jgi:ATP-dependent DNA helicase RecG
MAYRMFCGSGLRSLPAEMSAERFADRFPGEGDRVEFKQGVSETRIKDAVVAFSNSDGGVLLVGVNDSGG